MNTGEKPVVIGLLHSLSGTMAVSEKPLLDAGQMAIDEINDAGGILNHRIEALVADGGSSSEQFVQGARDLLDKKVAALFGCWTSASRKAVRPVVEAADSLLWYPVQYEGLEESSSICYTGSCLNQQIIPMLDWTIAQFGKRLFLVGSDYIFPRTTNQLIRSLAECRDGEIVAEQYVALGARDFRDIIKSIQQLRPSAVINSLNGDSNVDFYIACHKAGIRPSEIPIVATSIAETESVSMTAEIAGHFACWSYFQSVDLPENRRFLADFKRRFGQNRVVSAAMATAYLQVYLWKQAVERAGSFKASLVKTVLAGISFRSPLGEVRIEKNHHLSLPMRIGRAKPDGQFEIVWKKEEAITPLPWLGLEDINLPERAMLRNSLAAYADSIDYAWKLEYEISQRQLLESALQKTKAELELNIGDRTRQLQEAVVKLQQEIQVREAAQKTLRDSRVAALNMMEDAVEARQKAETTSVALQRELAERQRAEQSLRLFRALIDRSNDSIEVIDSETGRILDVNERALQLHGYSREEYLALTIPEIDPKYAVDWEKAWSVQVELLQRFGFQVFETEHRRKDGSIFPVEVNANYVRLEHDYILAVVRDITERKRAEEDIRRLNRLYAVLSNINVLIVRENNPQTMFEAACDIAVKIGKFRMAWIGRVDEVAQVLKPVASAGESDGFLDAINIDLTDNVRNSGVTGQTIATGQHQVCNDTANDPHLQPWREAALQLGYLAFAAFPLKIAGKVVGVFTLCAGEKDFFDTEEMKLLDELAGDISFALEMNQKELERQRAENEVHAAEERFRLLIENTSDIITAVNNRGEVQFVGPSVKQSLGYEPEELLHKSFLERVEPKDLEKVKAALKQALSDSTITASVEYRTKHKDGSWRILQSIGRSIPNLSPDGYIVVNSRDVTESRKLEGQFRQSQKMEAIGQLAGGVAHDFNNILGVIQMQSDLLRRRGGLSKEQSELADEIGNSTQRAAALTRQLLLFSRKETAQMQDLDMNNTVNNMTKMLQRVIGADVQVQFKFAMETLFVHADAGMLDQVLMNLVVNARDAMPGGGRIVIETSGSEFDDLSIANFPQARTGSFVCLSVSDTGSGIPPEVLPKIFEPFFTTKEVGKGTGLGLATVFGIVQQHQGWVNVYSEVGQGTIFRIYLPRIAKTSVSQKERPAFNTARGGKETILIAEDDTALRGAVCKMLWQLGYQVLDAANGLEAILIWKQKRDGIDLLLTDLVMPGGMNGKELAARLLKEKPNLKVIYTSGYSAEVVGKDFPLREGVNFLTKPYQALKLATTIRDNLDKLEESSKPH